VSPVVSSETRREPCVTHDFCAFLPACSCASNQTGKLADKTCNLRDIADAPPADWSLERRREYFDWAKRVVAALPAANAEPRTAFDAAYAARP
jgi:hypothetical protein